jgi:anthranilate synthase component II
LKKIAIIDNYDSFTHNLVHLVEKVGEEKVDVFLNDQVQLDTLSNYTHIIISPGAGLPANAGIVPQFLKTFHQQINILGICLGMQAIGEFFNSPLENLKEVMHGIATPITHLGNDVLFENIPTNFVVGRYHSWVIDKHKIDPDLQILAKDTAGEIMAIKHKTFNIRGVQFHPESILSTFGEVLIGNWLTHT